MDYEESIRIFKEISTYDGTEKDIEEAIGVLDAHKREAILTKSIYHKPSRPNNLFLQNTLLIAISYCSSLSVPHRINAATAATHKAIESMDEERVRLSTSRLLELFDSSRDEVGYSDSLREDKTHVVFSCFSVLFHVGIWLNDFTILDEYTDYIIEFSASEENLKAGYYQTCTNVARVMAFIMFVAASRNDYSRFREGYFLMRRSFLNGIVRADDHEVKFVEFTGAVKILHEAEKGNKTLGADCTLAEADRTRFVGQIRSMLLLSFRGHEKKKVIHMQRVVEEFLGNSLV